MQTEPKYWFPAKRYGWGWGLPSTWQGWTVLVILLALLLAGSFAFPPRTHPGAYLLYVMLLSAGLIGVCWLKGEPPRWRRGKNSSA